MLTLYYKVTILHALTSICLRGVDIDLSILDPLSADFALPLLPVLATGSQGVRRVEAVGSSTVHQSIPGLQGLPN